MGMHGPRRVRAWLADVSPVVGLIVALTCTLSAIHDNESCRTVEARTGTDSGLTPKESNQPGETDGTGRSDKLGDASVRMRWYGRLVNVMLNETCQRPSRN